MRSLFALNDKTEKSLSSPVIINLTGRRQTRAIAKIIGQDARRTVSVLQGLKAAGKAEYKDDKWQVPSKED